MIHRIQTLYFLLAAISGALLWYLDFREIANLASFILQSLLILIAVVAIPLWEKRPLQMRFAIAGILLSLVVLVLEYMTITGLRQTHVVIEGYHYVSPLLCLLMALFFYLAARGIHKDNRLLKSMDRLR
jgi:hypothetical protein